MIICASVSYCIIVNMKRFMSVPNLVRPDELASPDNTATAFPAPLCCLIFSTAAIRYNNLIVPSHLQQSQHHPWYSPSWPHSRTESRLPTLFPEQQAVPIRKVHLWRTCDSSVVFHRAYLVDFASLVPWYAHSWKKEPMARRRLDHMGPLRLHLCMLELSLI
jgi:hypothetical protein